MAYGTENVAKKWVARYDYTDPALGDVEYAFNIAWDLVVDDDGNVFTAGYEDFWDEDVNDRRQRWVIIKYDSKGRELWVRKYEEPGDGWAHTYFINSDGTGGVYVSGYGHTIRYASDGTVVWEKDLADIGIKKFIQYRGWGAHPETDSDGNYIYALSIATDWVPADWDPDTLIPGAYDIHVVKFNRSDGDATQLARYSGPDNLDDEAQGLFIDGADNMYVTGYTTRKQTSTDLLVLKYNPEGKLVWKATYNNELLDGFDQGNCIALDNEGDVYVTGMTQWDSYHPWYSDAVTLKFSSEGELLWDTIYSSPDAWRTTSSNLALDSRGDVYIAGYVYRSGTRGDIDLVKYESDSGAELWVKGWVSPAWDEMPEGKGVMVDKFDNVYLATGLNGEFYVAKLDPYRNVLWETVYNHPDSPSDQPFAMIMDGNGNVYVCGLEGSDWGPDVAVTIKYKQTKYIP